MSAFTPYQRDGFPKVSVIPACDVNSIRAMLQMYTAAVYSLGVKPVKVKENPPEKGSKFLMKNILKEEEEQKEVAPSEQASRLETLVSSLGKSEGGHRCLYCGKVYSRKYGLKIHIRTHTGYKPLKCSYCHRRFGDPSNLNKHVRLHSEGTTPYKCKICGKVLVRKRDLDRHLSARHEDNANPEESN